MVNIFAHSKFLYVGLVILCTGYCSCQLNNSTLPAQDWFIDEIFEKFANQDNKISLEGIYKNTFFYILK